jgi:hypothetical protein
LTVSGLTLNQVKLHCGHFLLLLLLIVIFLLFALVQLERAHLDILEAAMISRLLLFVRTYESTIFGVSCESLARLGILSEVLDSALRCRERLKVVQLLRTILSLLSECLRFLLLLTY